jgi:hypothetical protein
LSVSFLLRFLGFGLLLAGPLLLRRFLCGCGRPLLGLALGLLVLVAGYGSGGFLLILPLNFSDICVAFLIVWPFSLLRY